MKTLPFEELWDRAKAWCQERGLEQRHGAYQGAPPLCGYYVAPWFKLLGIPYTGLIHLDMDDDGEWNAHYEEPHVSH